MRFLHIEDKDKRRWLPALVILTAAVLLSFVGITVARYITRQEGQGIAEADNFYFTSDLLREKEENACYYVDPQTKEITVTLSNAADARRVTPGTITYRVEVTGGTVVSGSGSLPGGKEEKAIVSVSPDPDAKELSVTATAAPYEESLSAVFKLALGNQYTVEDAAGNAAAVLTITCTDDRKEIPLTLPDQVIPEETNDRVEKGSGGYMYKSQGKGIYSLVLLKADTKQDLTQKGSFGDQIVLTTEP